MTSPVSTLEAAPPVGRLVIFAMAIACGIAVANLYYSQPLLGLIAADLGLSEGAVGIVPMATQIGYALGLFLLVPLGDMLDRRRLILIQAGALTLALVGVALSPNLVVLIVGSVAIGIASSIAQQIIPFAAELADDGSRGRVVGVVMSGLLAGILLARVFSGLVGEHFGWRTTYWLAALLTIGLGVMLGRILPRGRARPDTRYLALLASIGAVARRNPLLIKSAVVQSTLFWGFSVFWSTLALYLASPRFLLGADVAGLFGILALVGVFAAPLPGAWPIPVARR
ncbi:MFS transporter [Oleomonas cavernae]|uniref:MFS transporter n=1 Tax=Oleomonas cavernae TaxID=2320859 RepID=UPI001F2BFDEE|nr:MFS transporter [Oleomonas cavernae]